MFYYNNITYEVQTFKNKDKRKSLLRNIFVCHSPVYICLFVAANLLQLKRAYDTARDENAMSSLIGYNRVYIKYIIGSVRKQPPLVYNKRLLLKISQYYRKITMLNSLFNNFIKKRLQHSCLLVNIVEILRSPILKNICERLLLSDGISTRSI